MSATASVLSAQRAGNASGPASERTLLPRLLGERNSLHPTPTPPPPTMDVQVTSPKSRLKKRITVRIACENCRIKKSRCDGNQPCRSCIGRHKDCVYRFAPGQSPREGRQREHSAMLAVLWFLQEEASPAEGERFLEFLRSRRTVSSASGPDVEAMLAFVNTVREEQAPRPSWPHGLPAVPDMKTEATGYTRMPVSTLMELSSTVEPKEDTGSPNDVDTHVFEIDIGSPRAISNICGPNCMCGASTDTNTDNVYEGLRTRGNTMDTTATDQDEAFSRRESTTLKFPYYLIH